MRRAPRKEYPGCLCLSVQTETQTVSTFRSNVERNASAHASDASPSPCRSASSGVSSRLPLGSRRSVEFRWVFGGVSRKGPSPHRFWFNSCIGTYTGLSWYKGLPAFTAGNRDQMHSKNCNTKEWLAIHTCPSMLRKLLPVPDASHPCTWRLDRTQSHWAMI